MESNSEHPLAEICQQWIRKIRAGVKHKRDVFQKTADECMRFYKGSHDWLYGGEKRGAGFYVDSEDIKTPFRMTVNKPAEMVQLFGPYLYHRNPNRLATPTKIDVPQLAMLLGGNPQYAQAIQMQQQQQYQYREAIAGLQQMVLNYTPNELGLHRESRRAVDEGMLKGRGCVWTEIYYPPGSDSPMVGSFYDSTDNLVTDPDADVAGEWKWIAKKCRAPHWELERDRGLPPNSLKRYAQTQSTEKNAKESVELDVEDKKTRKGETSDLVTYWKLYSKMGMGHYLRGVPDHYSQHLEQFGQFVYLEVINGCPYPLNLPPRIMNLDLRVPGNLDMVLNQVRWPIPLYADNAWPVVVLDFHEVPGCSWPMAHMMPALGELKAIDWIMSFLLSKVKVNSRDFLCIYEEMSEDNRLNITEGEDYSILWLKRSMQQRIDDLVQIKQFPPMNKDIMEVLNILMMMFDRRTGLNELLYGQTTKQMRSSAEAHLKGDMIQIRINDMAQTVEEWSSDVARQEGIANRLFLQGRDVAPIFGETHSPEQGQIGVLSNLWDQLVHTPVQPGDDKTLQRICREYEYRVEAGTVRRPNQQTEMENMDAAAQIFIPNLLGLYQSSGNPTQLNAFMTDWAKARQFDIDKYLFPPMPPPGTPPPEPEEQQQSSLGLVG